MRKTKIASPRVEEEAAEIFSMAKGMNTLQSNQEHCGKLHRKLSLKTICFLLAGGRISAGKDNYAVRLQAIHMRGLFEKRVDAVLLV